VEVEEGGIDVAVDGAGDLEGEPGDKEAAVGLGDMSAWALLLLMPVVMVEVSTYLLLLLAVILLRNIPRSLLPIKIMARRGLLHHNIDGNIERMGHMDRLDNRLDAIIKLDAIAARFLVCHAG
jgi:hypothetical protein